MDPRMEPEQTPAHADMDLTEDIWANKMDANEDVVTLGSDESSDSDEDDDIIPLPARLRNTTTQSTAASSGSSMTAPRVVPDVIDLTKEEEEEDDDDIMITETPTVNPVVEDNDMPELIEVEPVRAVDLAETHKKRGNDHFKTGEYYQALEHYTKAIDLLPAEASYHGNRSACYMMLKRYKEALCDIRKSIEMDPNYEKGYLRLIRTTLALGNIKECELAFQTIGKLGMDVGAKPEFERLTWLKNHVNEIHSTKAKKDYRKLVYLASQGLEVASADNQLKMLKADALVRLGRHTEAQELCTEVLQNDVRCAEALYIRAMCLYLDDNIDKSIQFVRQGLQYAPDNCSFQTLFKKLKQLKELRESGSSKYTTARYEEAKQDYSQCLAIVSGGEMNNITIQSKLNFNLALIYSKLGKIDESLEYCSKAIDLNSNYLKAILHRARQYVAKEMYDDAVHDFEAALRIDPTIPSVKKELQNTKVAAKRAKRKDYYKILNVDKNATEDEIRKAYKKRALLHHPDRHANAPEAVQKEQEKLFKDLGEAYEVLSDSKKRFRYDQGVDLMDDNTGGYHHYQDPSADFLNVFFAQGGIPSFRPGQTSGGGGRGPHQFHHTFRH